MKITTRFLIILSVLCTSWQVRAHQPDLASIILAEQENHTWVLQVRSALTAFEYVIEDHYGKDSYASPEEFQELVVHYIRNHISIRFNDAETAVLQRGMVKLGHETNVIFQLAGTPETISSLSVENNSFSNIPRSQGVLMIYKEGFEKNQFMLNQNNGHSIRLEAANSKFAVVEKVQGPAQPSFLLMVGLAIIAISVVVFVYPTQQGSSFNSNSFLKSA